MIIADAGRANDLTSTQSAADEHRAVRYEDHLVLESSSGAFRANVELRGQFRFSTLDVDADSDPASMRRDESDVSLNRARFKLGGHAFQPWMKYYTEYDFVSHYLLDLWIEPQPFEELGFRIGQYKVPYNRERFDSSGKQLFAERSVVTPPFTLDRQIGVTAMGRLFAGEGADSSYWVGVFRGTGRGGDGDGGSKPLVFGRWQWNVFRRVLPFSRSDISRRAKPAGSLALATASNRSAFTRFSSAGGGQLPGFDSGQKEQYDVDQAMGELAYMHRGFSVQSEYHWKRIDDRINSTSDELTGFYLDGGYFFSEIVDWMPEPLELIARYARVRPDDSRVATKQTEIAIGANWFFKGHRNKLTLDVTRLRETAGDVRNATWGTRLQWDVSF
ncbi:MAG: porin [Gammaproteobacteria bacterium]